MDKNLFLSDFDFDLPEQFIAQEPAKQREQSRLLVLNRKTGAIEHHRFFEIADFLNPNDLLVLNDTRVIPARLFGHKKSEGQAMPTGRQAEIEVLLLKDLGENTWEVLVKPGKRLKKDSEVIFGSGKLVGRVLEVLPSGEQVMQFQAQGEFGQVLSEIGKVPLPPYIKEEINPVLASRYQTVYAKKQGAVAAPTAGLHFTPELLESLKNKGVEIEKITLHTGLGTFQPIKAETVEEHEIHEEYCEVSKKVADKIFNAKRRGGRVVAVGTTTVRALETCEGKPFSGDTNIFIYPGFQFKIVDAMITNFHIPRSTLMLMVSAFASREFILRAYDEAKKNHYRFFSFGDAMFIK